METTEIRNAARLLERASEGEGRAADDLLRVVTNRLSALIEKSPPEAVDAGATNPLIRTAFEQLVGPTTVTAASRDHFLAVAARAMRTLLVDRAPAGTEVAALDAALQRLHRLDPRKATLVELRFFGGLALEDAARVLGLHPVNAAAQWQMARAWLNREVSEGGT